MGWHLGQTNSKQILIQTKFPPPETTNKHNSTGISQLPLKIPHVFRSRHLGLPWMKDTYEHYASRASQTNKQGCRIGTNRQYCSRRAVQERHFLISRIGKPCCFQILCRLSSGSSSGHSPRAWFAPARYHGSWQCCMTNTTYHRFKVMTGAISDANFPGLSSIREMRIFP